MVDFIDIWALNRYSIVASVYGGVPERSNGAVLKTAIPAMVSGVRIPPPPPVKFFWRGGRVVQGNGLLNRGA